MKYICESLFRLKELLKISLNLNDTRLRKIITNVVSDLDKATEPVECIENESKLEHIERKRINYFI